MSIRDEKRAFEAELPALLKDHHGEFVVFYSQKNRGLHPDFESAYRWALENLGAESEVLVARIEEPGSPETVSLAWEEGVMFA